MSRATEESLSNELFKSARLIPTLLLIVMPFGMGYYSQGSQCMK
jgi:hypothetical protein